MAALCFLKGYFSMARVGGCGSSLCSGALVLVLRVCLACRFSGFGLASRSCFWVLRLVLWLGLVFVLAWWVCVLVLRVACGLACWSCGLVLRVFVAFWVLCLGFAR